MAATKEEMMARHLKGRAISDPQVLLAMWEVDRALFVPVDIREQAYEDTALPIGMGQTISQPYIVSYMAQALRLRPDDVVLEVGTGCGYNAAVLSRLVARVYSVEVVEWLAQVANMNLGKAGVRNVTSRHGDGYRGWPEAAPFDAIILTAAPPSIPEPLKQQLKIGGRLLAPVGTNLQKLIMLVRAGENNFIERELIPVRFVPMTGEVQKSH
ncbi:protein-L-isoaspartate(D-aspartate) O-methyltransferase [Rufibacter immobilis]|uniref:Protein-L-isoaspartate O-methyltransferase n=1 Tax=Rufibacter immobilis TaxID=1348778 RepID=A0A3M9MUP4_9BACT|nr:protein-L-isoaspartate(D-aspartate) O-methyltransferase [Rufibacter immobilis]RNI28458.1 protein-L-isoaspartate(D-aspartate) O-methyltransferase [Rufibacter immobilis]